MSAIPVYLNPEAGGARPFARAAEGDRRFSLRDCAPGELADRLREAVCDGVPRVVVAGGDGTLNTAAGVLRNRDTELAVLPAGTLNHFARWLGVPLDPGEALEVAAAEGARTVGVGRVNDRIFLNTATVGAYVELVRRRTPLERWLGYRLGGVAAAAAILARPPVLSLEVEVEGVHRSYRGPVVFVGVGEREVAWPHLGERTGRHPWSLHVFAVQGGGRSRLVALGVAALARGLRWAARSPHLDAFLVDACELRLSRETVHVALDGETERLRVPLRFRMERDALRVVAPAHGGQG